MISLYFLSALLGLGYSGCNIAEVTNEYKGSILSNIGVTEWNNEVAFQIPAGACVSLYVENALEYSGKWTCKQDSTYGYYMKYELYDNSLCSGTPIDSSNPLNWFTIATAITVNVYGGNAYVFQSKQQAQNILAPSLTNFLGIEIPGPNQWFFDATTYYTGNIQCAESDNCGASIQQTLYSDTECAGIVKARQTIGNLVSGICAASVNAQLNLNLDCQLLEDNGVNITRITSKFPGICDGSTYAAAEFSMGYVCNEDALWLLAYEQPNCSGDGYIGLRINPFCYNLGLVSYELSISCSNPNNGGSLNLVYLEGDVAFDSGSNKYAVLCSIIFTFIVYIAQ